MQSHQVAPTGGVHIPPILNGGEFRHPPATLSLALTWQAANPNLPRAPYQRPGFDPSRMVSDTDKYERPIGVIFDTGQGRRIVGQLRLKRADLFDSNVVSIADEQFVHVDDAGSLHGVSEAGKVSLLDCVGGGMLSTAGWDDFSIHHGDVAFRYALFGHRHLGADQNCIRGIELTLDGVESSVFAYDKFQRFGHIDGADDEILDAIRRKRPDYLKGEFVKGQAIVSYFTGHWDVLPRFETALGTVHVGRSMRFDRFGRGLQDTPRIAVDFDDHPTTLEGAWRKMRKVRQFFALMMGYAPAWRDVVVFTSRLNDEGFRHDPNGRLEVFGPNEWKEIPEDAETGATLIDASRHPDHFVEVMTKWLERNEEPRRMSANTRYFGCLQGTSSRVIEDSIVSAANTFDLLPDQDKPEPEPLPDHVLKVLKDARAKIRSGMPPTPQRADVLNALGRIRANKRLRDVVEHRAAVVLDHFGGHSLRDLGAMIRLAVQCRNHYTHGPAEGPGEVDFADFKVVDVLTEILEFIYGASELLLCGWDPSTSARADWHPIGAYPSFHEQRRSAVLGPGAADESEPGPAE
ncbi:MAG: hypothetical protein F4X36_09025 [Gammaproteobacteria bacterium]|nr:hypothetical protein [Gammaproteobacteria bacterium]